MRNVSCLVAAVTLASILGACADPYPYGYRRSYVAAPDYYAYTPTTYYYASSDYYTPRTYGSRWDYYRNYNGSLHPVGSDM